jgi:hypothetical protein
MSAAAALEALWNSPPAGLLVRTQTAIPAPARKYLDHAIAPNVPLAGAVRLNMRGEIKLKGWNPFTADQVIHWNHGMIWNAAIRVLGVPVRGSDRFVNGSGISRPRFPHHRDGFSQIRDHASLGKTRVAHLLPRGMRGLYR